MKSPKDKWVRFLLSLWFWMSKNNAWNILSIDVSQLKTGGKVGDPHSPMSYQWSLLQIIECFLLSLWFCLSKNNTWNTLIDYYVWYTLTIIINIPSKHLLKFWLSGSSSPPTTLIFHPRGYCRPSVRAVTLAWGVIWISRIFYVFGGLYEEEEFPC